MSFWNALVEGKARSGEVRRVGKGGKIVYLQAVYTPIMFDGKVQKIVKFATDVTEEKLRNADFEAQLSAIGKSQAVVSFDLKGAITGCNEIFAKTLGYEKSELIGRLHRTLVDEQDTPQVEEMGENVLVWLICFCCSLMASTSKATTLSYCTDLYPSGVFSV